MKIKFTVIGAVLALCEALPASALTVGFNPTFHSVNVGTTTTVDLVISGLGDGTAPSLGTFDLDIGFDSSILGFSGATFGDQLDLFGLGDIQVLTPGVGTVNLFELSFELPVDLESLQADSFTLATLSFSALASGSSPLSLSVNALGDANGDALPADIVAGNITSISAVPVPTAAWLFGSSLIGLTGVARKRKAA